MARRILINEHELDALDGLPHLAVVLYMKAIRPYMDYATGITGIKRGISYQSIAEQLYIEPEQGRHNSGKPTKSTIRNAVKSLIKEGLLKIIPADKKLIFACLLAETDKSVLNNNDTSTTQQNDTAAAQALAAVQQELSQLKQAMNDIPNSNNSVTPPVSGESISLTTTTKDLKTVSEKQTPPQVVGGGEMDKLVFDKKLTDREQAAIRKALPATDLETAQALIDELAGVLRSPKQDIKNAVSYFAGMVKRFNAGEFVPTAGIAIAEAREKRKQEAIDAQKRRKQQTQTPEQRNNKTVRAGRAAMKAALGD